MLTSHRPPNGLRPAFWVSLRWRNQLPTTLWLEIDKWASFRLNQITYNFKGVWKDGKMLFHLIMSLPSWFPNITTIYHEHSMTTYTMNINEMACIGSQAFQCKKEKSHVTFPESQIADNLPQHQMYPWGKNDRKKTSVMINIKWPCFTVCLICHKHWFTDSHELTLQEYSKTEDNLSAGIHWPYLHLLYLILLSSLRCKEDRRKRKGINPCILNITVNLHEDK